MLDQPVAGLLKDMKQRGLLEDTLVVWTTEFDGLAILTKPEVGQISVIPGYVGMKLLEWTT